jgi:hypothetical protein
MNTARMCANFGKVYAKMCKIFAQIGYFTCMICNLKMHVADDRW